MDAIAAALRSAYPEALARILGQVRALPDAEDALQEAVARALERWEEEGIPDVPAAWLVRVAVNVQRDGYRRAQTRRSHEATLEQLAPRCRWTHQLLEAPEKLAWGDDMLRLVFTCCDPVLQLEERTALTLATVAGLSTSEIARAFLVKDAAMERRLSRARLRLRERRGEYEIPAPDVGPERVDAVLAVIHLIFNEGFWASGGDAPIRGELVDFATALARSLVEMLPECPEARGLLALLLLHRARLPARLDAQGRPVRLELQDRKRWDRAAIAAGRRCLDAALAAGRPGPFQIEAAIAAVHCAAETAAATDWCEIADLYESLEQVRASPVVRVNRAFAEGRARGAEAGLVLLAEIEEHPALARYAYRYLVRGALLEETGQLREAAAALERALAYAGNEAEKREIRARLDELLRRAN